MARERDVFLQERANGSYHPFSYYFVKVIFDLLPLRIIPAVVIGCLVYAMAGLQRDYVLFGYYLLVLVLFNIITTLICMTIASIFRNVSLANLVSIITLMFFMLFQGAMLNLGTFFFSFFFPFRKLKKKKKKNPFQNMSVG